MSCKDNHDGSCTVVYSTPDPGVYDVSIQFAEKHIPGSPFKVIIMNYTFIYLIFNY